jgi:hypothetical protein
MQAMAETPTQAGARARLLAAVRDPAGGIARLAPGEMDLALRLIRRANLMGNLAWRLRELGVSETLPRVAQDALTGAMALAEARGRAASWELNRIGRALSALSPEVHPVALKGCAYLLAGLPSSRGRLFADVDLLVAEEDLARVEEHLKSCGWRSVELTPYDENYYRVWTHELPPMTHPEREVEIDLHHNILMRTSRLRPDARALLSAARAVPGSPFRVLAPEDMVLHAIVHLFYGGEMDDAFRDLFDIGEMLRHFGSTEPGFWERFWPRATALNLQRPAFYALRYASRLLGTPIPEAVLQASRAGGPAAPVGWLMDWLVPEALFPLHPDRPRSKVVSLARLLLFMRSHWVKMPPLLLLRHLTFKMRVRYRGARMADTA